jgi:phosphatidate phosphatase APP1
LSQAQISSPPHSQKAPFVLITDVDDTIKVSHILDPVGKVIRFLADPVAFAGMSTLYHQLLDHANRDGRDHGFAVVSGTPWVLGWSVWEFLGEFAFPEASILATRPIAVDTLEFKSDEISKILDQDALNGAQIVLVGDDTEADHEAYSAAKRQVADLRKMKTEIFIRRVSERVVSQGDTFAFDSAADIAVVQFLGGRLTEADVEKVFREIEAESDLENLFVPGGYCPDFQQGRLSDDKRIAKVPRAMLDRLTEVENHLRRICSESSSWFAANGPKVIQLSPRVRNAL